MKPEFLLENVYCFTKDSKGRYLGCDDKFAARFNLTQYNTIRNKTDETFPWDFFGIDHNVFFSLDQALQKGQAMAKGQCAPPPNCNLNHTFSIYEIATHDQENKLNEILVILVERPIERQTEQTESQEKILLVDDENMALTCGKLALMHAGFSVDTATTGEMALNLASKNTYRAIFMDIDLPGMDGAITAREIRKNEQNFHRSRTPIFATTAHADEKYKIHCQSMGMDSFVEKPLSEDKIKNLIKNHPGINLPSSAPSSTSTIPPIVSNMLDINNIVKSSGCDKKTAISVAKGFLDSLSNTRQELEILFYSHDKEAFMSSVHKLKGSTAYVGAEKLHNITNRIEACERSKSITELKPLYLQLISEIRRIQTAKLC